MLDQHPERRSPLADVVLARNCVAEPFEQADNGIAEDRRAQVADVHLLGGVRRRVVDDDRLGCCGARDAEALVGADLCQQSAECRLGQGQVDEAGAGDLGARAEVREVSAVKDGRRDISRALAQPAGPVPGRRQPGSRRAASAERRGQRPARRRRRRRLVGGWRAALSDLAWSSRRVNAPAPTIPESCRIGAAGKRTPSAPERRDFPGAEGYRDALDPNRDRFPVRAGRSGVCQASRARVSSARADCPMKGP